MVYNKIPKFTNLKEFKNLITKIVVYILILGVDFVLNHKFNKFN